MMLATNAQKIVELRKRGYKPDEMILVSLVGKIDELNHTVYAIAKNEYDWKWCRGLDICVYASSGVDWFQTIKAIADTKPRYLAIWDVDRKEGAEFWRLPCEKALDKPQRELKMKLIPNPWCSIQNKMFSGELCS